MVVTSPSAMAAIKTLVDAQIAENAVVVYSKSEGRFFALVYTQVGVLTVAKRSRR
jgi:hypothetical protein